MARILIVEDETLIGLDLEDVLQNAGFETAGPARTAREAMDLIAGGGVDAALLDVTLADGTSVEVARALRSLGVPFAVVSGNLSSAIPPDLAEAPFIPKPSRPDTIVATLRRLTRR